MKTEKHLNIICKVLTWTLDVICLMPTFKSNSHRLLLRSTDNLITTTTAIKRKMQIYSQFCKIFVQIRCLRRLINHFYFFPFSLWSYILWDISTLCANTCRFLSFTYPNIEVHSCRSMKITVSWGMNRISKEFLALIFWKHYWACSKNCSASITDSLWPKSDQQLVHLFDFLTLYHTISRNRIYLKYLRVMLSSW